MSESLNTRIDRRLYRWRQRRKFRTAANRRRNSLATQNVQGATTDGANNFQDGQSSRNTAVMPGNAFGETAASNSTGAKLPTAPVQFLKL